MPRPEARKTTKSARPFQMALAATVILILYGSLFPFEFYDRGSLTVGVRELLATWKAHFSRGDLLANILLYLPLGLFAAKAFRRMPPLMRVIIGVLGGAALSTGVELTQLYDRGRESAMSDIYANTFGSFIGAVAGAALSIDIGFLHWQGLRRRPFAPFLIFCWLGYRLFPYAPVIDLHKYWHAVRPLLQGPGPGFADTVRHFASWLAVGALLKAAWGAVKSRFGLVLLMAFVFCARIAIGEITLSRAEVVGAVAALMIWVVWLYASRMQRPILAAVLAAAILVEALQPFEFLAVPRSFGWIPFISLIDGSIAISVPSLLAKFFLYGSLVWALWQLRIRWTVATLISAVFVFVLHYLQIYLPGRSAEITDTLLVVMAGALLRAMDGGSGVESDARSPGELRAARY